MNRSIKNVRDFLASKLTSNRALLLALSGGGDSLALFHILIRCRHFFDFTLHVAHVDHAWRAESFAQAQTLELFVRSFSIPFYCRRLNPMSGSNLEERCREERYAFFSELQDKWDFQAVLLGHHADDQGETVLKRLCEGARIGALGGLRRETTRENLTLWRPLLSSRKEELTAFLQSEQITPIDDWTNRNTYYLRSRIRLQIFPQLEKQFGKNMGRNFYRFALLFQEIRDYLEEKNKQIEKRAVRGLFGTYLERPAEIPRLEMRYFLEETARRHGAHLSHDSCNTLLDLIANHVCSAAIHTDRIIYILNKNILFLIKMPLVSFNLRDWRLAKGLSTWREFWNGEFSMPKGAKPLLIDALSPILRKKMKLWYTQNNVPPFFHDKAPIFCIRKEIVGECLTGRLLNNLYLKPEKNSGINSEIF